MESEMRAGHHIGLSGDWALWRDFAVRSTGFGIDRLEVFGTPDEEARLAQVARDPRFREAVAWQSREALRGGVDKLAAGGESPSRRQRRAEVVASYLQRYCAKNDTIGFFGPLSWGRFAEEGAAIDVRPGTLDAHCVVHFETWAVEAVARALGDDALLPMDPFPERVLCVQDSAGTPKVWRRSTDSKPHAPRSLPPHRMFSRSHSMSWTGYSRSSPAVPPCVARTTAAAGGPSPTSIASATST